MSGDLAAFLQDCLDEDERIARAATAGPWAWTSETDVWDQNGPTLIREGTDAPDAELAEVAAGWGHDAWGMHIGDADQAHIAAHDPARVLAEVAIDQELLREYVVILRAHEVHQTEAAALAADIEHEERTGQWSGVGLPDVRQRALRREADYLPAMLHMLERWARAKAVVYADRPGYKEAWQP